MPHIIVTAGDARDLEGAIMLRERINVSDFESERFAVNLVERLAWAVTDATEAEAVEQWPRREEPQDRPVEAESPHELVEA